MAIGQDITVRIKVDSGGANIGLNSIRTSLADMGSKANEVDSILNRIKDSFLSLIVGDISNKIMDVSNKFTSLHSTLLAVSDSEKNTAKDMDFISKVSEKLGQDILTTGESFSKFSLSTKGTAIEGEAAKKIFEQVASALAVMHAPAEKSRLVFLALEQMMSKGTVQAQELKLQMGNQLPGAFNIAAQSIDVSTKQFMKLMETGNIISADFLPKFGNAIEKTFGKGLSTALEGAVANVNRLNNAITKNTEIFAESGYSAAYIYGVKELTKTLNSPELQESLKELGRGIGQIMIALIDGAKILIEFARNTEKTAEEIKILMAEVSVIIVALESLGVIGGTIISIFSKISILFSAGWSSYKVVQLAASIKDFSSSLDGLESKLNNSKNKFIETQNKVSINDDTFRKLTDTTKDLVDKMGLLDGMTIKELIGLKSLLRSTLDLNSAETLKINSEKTFLGLSEEKEKRLKELEESEKTYSQVLIEANNILKERGVGFVNVFEAQDKVHESSKEFIEDAATVTKRIQEIEKAFEQMAADELVINKDFIKNNKAITEGLISQTKERVDRGYYYEAQGEAQIYNLKVAELKKHKQLADELVQTLDFYGQQESENYKKALKDQEHADEQYRDNKEKLTRSLSEKLTTLFFNEKEQYKKNIKELLDINNSYADLRVERIREMISLSRKATDDDFTKNASKIKEFNLLLDEARQSLVAKDVERAEKYFREAKNIGSTLENQRDATKAVNMAIDGQIQLLDIKYAKALKSEAQAWNNITTTADLYRKTNSIINDVYQTSERVNESLAKPKGVILKTDLATGEIKKILVEDLDAKRIIETSKNINLNVVPAKKSLDELSQKVMNAEKIINTAKTLNIETKLAENAINETEKKIKETKTNLTLDLLTEKANKTLEAFIALSDYIHAQLTLDLLTENANKTLEAFIALSDYIHAKLTLDLLTENANKTLAAFIALSDYIHAKLTLDLLTEKANKTLAAFIAMSDYIHAQLTLEIKADASHVNRTWISIRDFFEDAYVSIRLFLDDSPFWNRFNYDAYWASQPLYKKIIYYNQGGLVDIAASSVQTGSMSTMLTAAPIAVAGGGRIPGYGTVDDVPALLTKGEFVINSKSVKTIESIIPGFFNAINSLLSEQQAKKFFKIEKKSLGGFIDSFSLASLDQFINNNNKQFDSMHNIIINNDKFLADKLDKALTNVHQDNKLNNIVFNINFSGLDGADMHNVFIQKIIPEIKNAIELNAGGIRTSINSISR